MTKTLQKSHEMPPKHPSLITRSALGICLGLCTATTAFAAAGPGSIVQGVLNFPDFKSGPTGSVGDISDPSGISIAPYSLLLNDPNFPVVDDSVHAPGIPGVSVYLKNVATNAVTATITTDSRGVFVFPSQPVGTYTLCWTTGMPGILPACATDLYAFSTFDVIDQASTRWVANLGGSSLFDWTATTLDSTQNLSFEGYVTAPGLPTPYQPNLNTACVYNDPFFGFDETAAIQLLDTATGKVLSTARANSLGRFLLTVPAPAAATNYTLKASCGSNWTSTPFNAVTGSARLFVNLTLPSNSPPAITSLAGRARITRYSTTGIATTAYWGGGLGTPLAGAPLGTTILATVRAADPNGNALSYRWKATAGTVSFFGNSATWVLPKTGKGLHFLYVDVNDGKGGHAFDRIAISTDGGFVAAPPPPSVKPPKAPADLYTESDRFLTYRGIDTAKSACQYYLAIGAVKSCGLTGNLVGAITFDQWLAKFGLTKPPSPYSATPPLNKGEYHAQFRNVADLNLIRNHHGRNAGPDANLQDQVAYFVCNHGKAQGATPDVNLVACVSMEYSVTPGQNDGKPFTKFLTFGPTGALIPSINLDGRGEKYTPGNCVPCHGGDNYFYRFPEQGAGAHDGNIGAYFIPFDLENFEYEAPYTQAVQEDAVRALNLGMKTGEMLTPAAQELVDGWYPGGAGIQLTNFVPRGWNENLPSPSPDIPPPPKVGDIDPENFTTYDFKASDLYLKVVKPSCRGCHLAMGPKLGLSFQSYYYDGVNPGDFVQGNAVIDRSSNNDIHIYNTVCEKFQDGIPTFNFFEDLNSPAKTMPNAIQTFNRYWNDPVQTDLMQKFLVARNEADPVNGTPCFAPGQ